MLPHCQDNKLSLLIQEMFVKIESMSFVYNHSTYYGKLIIIVFYYFQYTVTMFKSLSLAKSKYHHIILKNCCSNPYQVKLMYHTYQSRGQFTVMFGSMSLVVVSNYYVAPDRGTSTKTVPNDIFLYPYGNTTRNLPDILFCSHDFDQILVQMMELNKNDQSNRSPSKRGMYKILIKHR